jgi:hypothetical protein
VFSPPSTDFSFRFHQLTSVFVSIYWLLFSFPSTDFCFRPHQLTSVFAPINFHVNILHFGFNLYHLNSKHIILSFQWWKSLNNAIK